MNEALRKGQYFFTDIRKEGVVLYELDDEPLAEPGPLTPQDAYEMAKEHYEHRFTTAVGLLDTARYMRSQGRRN